jgi:hypothetical protein
MLGGVCLLLLRNLYAGHRGSVKAYGAVREEA